MISFISQLLTTSPSNVLADDVDVITKPAIIEESNGEKDVLIGANGEPLEELDVQETVVLEEKDPEILRTLLIGRPSPSSLLWSAITFLINLVSILLVVDFAYRAYHLHPSHDLSFARVGFVSDTTANLLMRDPNATAYPVYLSYRYADAPMSSRPYDSAWKHAATLPLASNTTDYTTTIEIDRLSPDTRYQYVFSNAHKGFFITAPRPGQISERATFSDAFTFLHSSCIIPRFPYNPLAHPLHIPGFTYLAPWLSKLKPSFFLFLGDFIYADVPVRHGADAESFRRLYRHVYASPAWPSVSRTKAEVNVDDYHDFDVPWYHIYDDHEISNDWSAGTTGVYPAAFDPYAHYHIAPNPPPYIGPYSPKRPESPLEVLESNTTYFAFTHGPASFFLMDNRRFRTEPNTPDATMLGRQQLEAFEQWASESPPPGVRWKIIVSSIPFTKNWRVNGKDTWAGYLSERKRVLEHLWTVTANSHHGIRFVILSGDRHEFAATAFPPPIEDSARWPRERTTVYEFSASPLDMFYLPIRTYHASQGKDDRDGLEDLQIKYLPDGNHKFGSVSIGRETASGQSLLRYRLFIEGKEAWDYVIVNDGPTVDGKELWA